jgi:hypothetical protein
MRFSNAWRKRAGFPKKNSFARPLTGKCLPYLLVFETWMPGSEKKPSSRNEWQQAPFLVRVNGIERLATRIHRHGE